MRGALLHRGAPRVQLTMKKPIVINLYQLLTFIFGVMREVGRVVEREDGG